MPRIDPFQLLKILSVLLAPNGGIKSRDEVQRIASLMFKFSKKLVSKCIYVSILKASEPDLLIMWMSAGGWDLIYNWLSDAVLAENWPLVSELVDLLLICPVDIERLKSNRCPKLIKTLSKNQSASESVQLAAAQIVKKWLDVVNDVLIKQKATPSVDETDNQDKSPNNEIVEDNQQLPVYRIIKQDGKEVLTKVPPKEESKQDIEFVSDINEVNDNELPPQKIEVEKPVKQSALKTKKSIDEVVPAKTKKIDGFSDDSSQSSCSGSERGENSGLDPSPFVPSNKSDPKKDRRKDKMRQIRKDPDADDKDFVLEDFEYESSAVRSKKKKIESRENKLKLNKKPPVKPVKTKVSDELTAIVMQVRNSNPDISKLGRIPKKSDRKDIKKDGNEKKTTTIDENHASDKQEKKTGSKTRESDKDISKSKDRLKSPEKDAKTSSSGKSDANVKKPSEIRKPPPPEIKRDSKKYNISVEARKVAPGESRPKTVKTYNSKFRSTGLEEELPPPPAQKSSKKVGLPPLSLHEKKPIKRISPTKEVQPPEKKAKAESNEAKKPSASAVDKSPVAAAATVSVPKQSPVSKAKFLQESGSFMDALNASMSSSKDSKKKKTRRLSNSKDSDKKESTPPTSPNQDEKSPPVAKPNFRFYQDTLDHSEDTNKSEMADEIKKVKEDPGDLEGDGDSNEEKRSSTPETPEQKAAREANIKNEENRQKAEGLKGVLVFAKLRKGPKKSVQWKTDLTAVKFFELEENERVNVTKTFVDMMQLERHHERENFQIARKLGNVDVMEEKTRWKSLIPIDLPALPVIPGKNSNEKEIQYAREKTAVPAIYPYKRLIPDSPAEPDLEIHATTDPTIIPLDDLSGNEDSVNDFTNVPWPEPKTEILPAPCEPIMGPGMGSNGPMGPTHGPMGPVGPNFMGPGGGPMPVGPAGFPGPGPNQGGPGMMGPMAPGPNMGFPGYPGPGAPFGPPQPGPPNMGMMGGGPNDWMGPGPDMNGPVGPGPEMFGPGGPGMGPPPGMMPPPDMAFGMGVGGPPLMPGGMLGPGGPMPPGPPGPFNMNQPPNMFNGPGPGPGPGPSFPPGPNNSNGGGGGGGNNQNWNRGGDDRNDRGNGRGGGGGGGGGPGPWRNKRDRRGGDNWRGGRGGGNNWGGSKNVLCNNFARWGSCRTVNCNYRHHN